MLVLRHLFDSARIRISTTSYGSAGLRLRSFCLRVRRGFMLGITHLVFRMLSTPLCFKVLPFRFGTGCAELDERESVENRACKNAATTSSAGVPCSSSDTITFRVAYGTDYLSNLC